MPLNKVGEDKYISKSGRKWSLAQIRAYLAKKKADKKD